MAAASTARSTGPRYAPPDPTLPKPWKGLVDGSTGNLYFWNPETNVTQYQKPSAVLPDSPPLLESVPISSSGDTQQLIASSSQGQKECNSNEDNNQCKSNCSGEAEGPKGNSTAVELPDATTKRGCSDGSTYNSGSTPQPLGISAELYRHKHEISVLGGDVPMPFMTFESTGFPAPLLREVQRAGFSAPTPIQAQTWPIALQNRDIVAVAKTGSGKTLGYLFPGFIHLKRLQKNNQMGPTMLVLSPTRELATQIQDEAVKFGSAGSISCTCLYGGAPKGPQLRDLDRGTDVVVATPGRLNDILEMKRVSLQQVSYLVLDEADRMLDMGFEPQIRKIVKEIPARRQTLMYTATWPKEVRKIAADLLVKPVQVNIGNIDELVANKSITQHVEMVNSMEKRRRLEQILQSQQPGSKIIIFCATKRMCDQLARNLDQQFGAAAIHGDKSQGDRDFVLSQFRTGKAPILVATDVAARGLDIKDIRVVVNYDFPTGIEDYVHRIGRTGRAGATGVAYTFFSDQDGKYAPDLVKILEGASQKVPLELRKIAAYGGGYGGGVRSSRQWGSGCGGGRSGSYGGGGRNNSTFGSLSSQTTSGGWSGGGNDSGSHDWQRSRFEVDAHGGYGNKEQHVADNGFAENCIRNRSRSPVNRGWGGNS